jgi:murein DD-endopeptidase MepM/ murein hydrolase activator NlpD
VYHRVQPGENLYRIGKAYGVPYRRIAEENDLADPSRIIAGQKLYIPGARRPVPVDVVTPRSANPNPPAARKQPAVRMVWPVTKGRVTSGFGPRGRSHHDGIDISAPVGTPVRAAAAGKVIYSDALRGYGNVIIVRHSKGYATVYAHNQRNGKRVGQKVRRGDVIASVGATGRTSGANLHFEVRENNVARNPLFFLPARQHAGASPGTARPGS